MDTEAIIKTQIYNASTAEILRGMEKSPYETVFIIGTGVVEGGWEAFGDGVSRATGFPIHATEPIPPTAYLIYGLRVMAQSSDKSAPNYIKRYEGIESIRKSIAESFVERQKRGELRLRITPATDFVEQYKRGQTVILTTNWDTLLEDYYTATSRFSVFYLHGNVRDPNGVYLPTESAIEPYRDAKSPATVYLRGVHAVALEALKQAKRIVLWGSSLDVYDTELCLLLGETHRWAMHEKVTREYIVVDPSRKPVDRLAALLGDASIRHVNPLESTEGV